jgi:hypothetical protein
MCNTSLTVAQVFAYPYFLNFQEIILPNFLYPGGFNNGNEI